MDNLQYVKKRKRKRAVLVLASVSLVGLAGLTLVAFLGRNVGSFTVSLDNSGLELSMSKTKDFSSKTSYIKSDQSGNFSPTTYSKILDYGHSQIDNEAASSSVNYNGTINYFKLTFYIKNTGQITAGYNLALNVLDNRLGDNNRNLLDIIRVVLYENDVSETSEEKHEMVNAKPYARHSLTTDEKGNYLPEYITDESDGYGYANQFLSDTKLISLNNNGFLPNEIKRYTIVFWLEGADPEVTGVVPNNAKLTLGIEVKAYENEVK